MRERLSKGHVLLLVLVWALPMGLAAWDRWGLAAPMSVVVAAYLIGHGVAAYRWRTR